MPSCEPVDIDVRDLALADATGRPTRLSELPGAQVLLLMRHRH